MANRPNAVEREAITYLAVSRGSDARALREAIEAKFPGAITRAVTTRRKVRFEAKFTGNPPAWAKRLVAKHAPDIARLNWRRSRTKWNTSGHCSLWGGEMTITVGRGNGHSEDGGKTVVWTHDEDEDRYVLLHEIAHHKTHELHTDKFWDCLYGLVVEEGLYRKTMATEHRVGSLKVAASRARKRGSET